MAGFKINRFSGIVPRLPDSLLPERSASLSQNCDFAYGELRGTKDKFLLGSTSVLPMSLYTDNGLRFFAWPGDVDAVRPLAKDTEDRVYYTTGSSFRLTLLGLMNTIGGLPIGPPGTSSAVGVPMPSNKPVLAAQIPVINATTATLTFTFHYEQSGVRYQETTITPAVLSNNQYRFTPPALVSMVTHSAKSSFPATGSTGVIYKASDTGQLYTWSGTAYVSTTNSATPSGAQAVLRMKAVSLTDASPIFDIYTDNSSFGSAGGIYSLSMSKDSGQNTYTATLAVGVKEEDKETRAYVYTYVNTFGEEGPPSLPTTVDTSPVVDVTVTVKKDSNGDYLPFKEIRLYRTSVTVPDYFFVGSASVLNTAAGADVVFNDDVRGAQLNEPLSSTDYYPPPNNLVGLMSLPNGILCGWAGNKLYFSEAYKPWAWPPKYMKPLPNNIVGGIAHGAGAVITTLGQPYAVSGVSPDAMTTMRLNVDQAGVSKWSLAVVDGAAIYASHDGLVVLSGNTASLAQSAKFFTREVWRERYAAGLSTMRFSVWDGRLIVWSSSNQFVPFMIRLDEADGSMTTLPDLLATCGFVSQLSDQFYYASGQYIYQFNGGDNVDAGWQSREVVLTTPVNFGVAQAVCTGNWTIQFLANGVVKHTEVIAPGTSPKTFRLPAGFKSDRWKVNITGSGAFKELRVAQTGRELAVL